MKLPAAIARSLRTAMQAELRGIERAVATGTRDAGRGLTADELQASVIRLLSRIAEDDH